MLLSGTLRSVCCSWVLEVFLGMVSFSGLILADLWVGCRFGWSLFMLIFLSVFLTRTLDLTFLFPFTFFCYYFWYYLFNKRYPDDLDEY